MDCSFHGRFVAVVNLLSRGLSPAGLGSLMHLATDGLGLGLGLDMSGLGLDSRHIWSWSRILPGLDNIPASMPSFKYLRLAIFVLSC